MIGISQLQEYNLTSSQMSLLFRLRMIWRDIATWLNIYLAYVFLDADPELRQGAASRLLSLPVAYANIFRIYFGDLIGDQHTALMSNYISLLISLIDAAKSGDSNAVNEYSNQLAQNIEDRVNFLTSINPFWDRNTMSAFLTNFNNLVMNEINSYVNKSYLNNAELFGSLLTYTDRMGDYFADGLLKYLTYSTRQPRS